MFWSSKFGFSMVLMTILSFLAMSHNFFDFDLNNFIQPHPRPTRTGLRHDLLLILIIYDDDFDLINCVWCGYNTVFGATTMQSINPQIIYLSIIAHF